MFITSGKLTALHFSFYSCVLFRKGWIKNKQSAPEVQELKDIARNDSSQISVVVKEETTIMIGNDNVMPLMPVLSIDFYSRDSE